MLQQTMFEGIPSTTISPASEDGRLPCDSPDGPTSEKSAETPLRRACNYWHDAGTRLVVLNITAVEWLGKTPQEAGLPEKA
jgi:hypothetical protein